jgi:hypothetical protein
MEEDLLGTFSRTRKPYLNGSGSSAWGVLISSGKRSEFSFKNLLVGLVLIAG